MGWYDYISDLASSLTIQSVEAEQQTNAGPTDTSGEQSSGKDARSGGVGNAQHDRGATTRGGVSTASPASGSDEESDSEAEANKQDAKSGGSGEKGQTPGSGDGYDLQGKDLKKEQGVKDDDEEEEEAGEDEDEEEEEEEEDDEPVCPKDKLEEECMKTQQCAPLKHHYDECAERVTKQQEENGKADEDCVEEFFHLMHCASQCAAPKLFKQLR
nr:cytochrome b-c1 complex subunit 6 [Quercus suber]